MIDRSFWTSRLQQAWTQAPIAWLCGVRRSGKTTIARDLDATTYFNCDLPAVEDRVRDPELFYRSINTPVVVFDEIHQLKDPTRLLKIGADQFPHLKILATGSSTLAASRTFRDTLTGRKRTIHLVPVLWSELDTFGAPLDRRLLHGGLPQPLLATKKDPAFFREWMDSFFARDIQRLFGFRDVSRFNAVLEFMLRQSSGQFETTKAARALGISRQTVESHLRALEITNAVTIVRPYHRGNASELVKMPKVYGFDTGFVSFVRGWDSLRQDDRGGLWEHLVLEFIQAHRPDDRIHYWRDRTGREVDLVIPRGRDTVDAIECKWEASHFDSSALRVFRATHPKGRNFVIAPIAGPAYQKRFGELTVTVGAPEALLP